MRSVVLYHQELSSADGPSSPKPPGDLGYGTCCADANAELSVLYVLLLSAKANLVRVGA